MVRQKYGYVTEVPAKMGIELNQLWIRFCAGETIEEKIIKLS
jgi:hypothetical protein